jgi:hypothetical protein
VHFLCGDITVSKNVLDQQVCQIGSFLYISGSKASAQDRATRHIRAEGQSSEAKLRDYYRLFNNVQNWRPQLQIVNQLETPVSPLYKRAI